MKKILLAMSALGLVGAANPAATQFDLECATLDGKPSNHYRINLSTQEWCLGVCKDIKKIASVTSGTLVLSEINMSDDPPTSIEINRATGEAHVRFFLLGRIWTDSRDICKLAPFSGFPEAKF